MMRGITAQILTFCVILLPVTFIYGHGDLHEQIETVSRHLEQGASAELYLKRAELHRAHKDYKAAFADYDRAKTLDPKFAAVHLARGRTLLEAGQLNAAEEALSHFLELRPGHYDAHLCRARSAMGLKRFEQASADYERSIQLAEAPKPDLFLEWADALKSGGKLGDALNSLEQGIAKLGRLVTLETAALEMEVGLKRYDAAITRVDRLLATARRKEIWYERKAGILVQAGRAQEARQSYEAALGAVTTLPARLRNTRAAQRMEERLRSALAILDQKHS